MDIAALNLAAIVVLFVMLLGMGLILARLYKRASKEISFVRTGFRGQKVVMNGGSLVLPVLHDIIPVNMNTLRLEVLRSNEQALITRDRMRVDVMAEFYVRVKPTVEAIANAAQTLGKKTMYPDELKELVEGKFVDALRAVAAEMAMEELHEQRVDFVQKVQMAVSEDLLKNGLELESVSLTGLDQTSKAYLNPDNAFDAQGLTKLTEEIEDRRKRRNEIEQDTQVAIANKNLEAERQRLEIAKEEEYAKIQQNREIEIRRAAGSAEIAKEQAQKQREAREAEITANTKVDMANIEAKRTVNEEQITVDQQIRAMEIAKEKALETAEIERRKALELAEQDRSIAVAEKSKAQSEAQAEADKARSLAVKQEERVITARQSEVADREKAVELIEARKLAEREAIAIEVAAHAEKVAAEDNAEAVRILANAESEKEKIHAQGRAEAEKLKAAAAAARYTVDAEGERAMNEARNILTPELIEMQVKLALIKHLPEIIKESVKPMEQIDDIKIYEVNGLGGGNGNGTALSSAEGNETGSLSDRLVNSALRYRGQAPLVDALLEEIGLKGGDINGLTNIATGKDTKADDD